MRALRLASFYLFYMVCLHALSAVENASSPDEQLRRTVFPKLWNANAKEMQKLTSDQRTSLVNYLKQRIGRLEAAGYNTINADGTSEAAELAMLDDEEGRTRIVREYLRDPDINTKTLRSIDNPKLIAMIGEDLFKEEPPFKHEGDVGRLGKQEWARQNILYMVERSAEFDDAVRAWARRMDRNQYADPDVTALMRDWYRRNEAALKASDFGKVRPGSELLRTAANAEAVTSEPVIFPNNASPTTALAATGNRPAAAGTSDEGGISKWIASVLIAVFVIGGGLFAWRRQMGMRN